MSDPSSDNFIRYECQDRIATITFNRPEKLNAFNDAMVMRLANVLDAFDIDENANVAVIRGEGRAFYKRGGRASASASQRGGHEEAWWFAGMGGTRRRPVHAGHQLETCHHSAAWVCGRPRARHGAGKRVGGSRGGYPSQVAETSRGLAASRYWALLNFRGGRSFATEVTIAGRFFTAEEAFEAGIVSRIGPRGQHVQQAYEMARQVAENPPLSVRATVRTRRWYMDQAERGRPICKPRRSSCT